MEVAEMCPCGAEPLFTFALVPDDESPEEGLLLKGMYRCLNCLKNNYHYCDHHGPHILVDDPKLQTEIWGVYREGAYSSYCPGCVHEEIRELGDRRIAEYSTLIEQGLTEDVTEKMIKWSDFLLNDRATADEKIIFNAAIVANLYDLTIQAAIIKMIKDVSCEAGACTTSQ